MAIAKNANEDNRDPLLAGLLDHSSAGTRRALAQAITLAESRCAKDRQRACELLQQLRKARAESHKKAKGEPPSGCRRIGITGAPGAGKSTLIAALCARLLKRSAGKIAVVAIDPSAVGGGGAILADKTRMGKITDQQRVFVRPSPAAEGEALARGLFESILFYENCGFTTVIVESVGAGQAETAIADYVDCLLLLVAPKSGDALQGMKRGILELADFLIVSKADGRERGLAQKTLDEYRQAALCFTSTAADKSARYRICSAQRKDDIENLCVAIDEFFLKQRKHFFLQRRARQKQNLFLRAWTEFALEYALTQVPTPKITKGVARKRVSHQEMLVQSFTKILKTLAKEDQSLPAESARMFFSPSPPKVN